MGFVGPDLARQCSPLKARLEPHVRHLAKFVSLRIESLGFFCTFKITSL